VRGALLVGTGRARADGTITIEQQRLTWWSGEDARTVTFPPRGNLGALLRNV